jgi:hypothetical protein
MFLYDHKKCHEMYVGSPNLYKQNVTEGGGGLSE